MDKSFDRKCFILFKNIFGRTWFVIDNLFFAKLPVRLFLILPIPSSPSLTKIQDQVRDRSLKIWDQKVSGRVSSPHLPPPPAMPE